MILFHDSEVLELFFVAVAGLEPATSCFLHLPLLGRALPTELHDNIKARTIARTGTISIIKYNLDKSHIFNTLNFCYALVLI